MVWFLENSAQDYSKIVFGWITNTGNQTITLIGKIQLRVEIWL